jgi:hypothetical protein
MWLGIRPSSSSCVYSHANSWFGSSRCSPPQHHLEGVLLHQLDRVELRIEHSRDRIRLRERLADEREGRRQADAVLEGDALQVGERLTGANGRERPPVVPRELTPQFLDEARLVGAERHAREAEDEVGDIVGAVLRDGEKQQREPVARVVVETAEQAEVHERETSVRREQDVPAVRIGVVDALHGHLMHVGAEELARQLSRALSAEPVVGVDLAPCDALEHQHSLRHVRPDHRRHDEILVLAHEACDELGVVRLLDEVELAAQMHFELVSERTRLQKLRALRVRLEQLRRRAHQREVDVDLVLDPRAAHLDDHLPPARQQRRVDLRDRRRREWLRVDADERVRRQLRRDHFTDLIERHRRDLVHELAELLDVHVGKQVGPRRKELAELDIRRAELLERVPKLAGALTGRGTVAPNPQLAQHAQKTAAPGDASDVDSTLDPLRPRAHQPAYLPRVSPGNARASRAVARESGRPPRGAHAAHGRRGPHRGGRRE